VRIVTKRHDSGWLSLGLFGAHQAANSAAAVATVERLRDAGLLVPEAAVAAGLQDVVWPARMELLGRRPTIVLDCAHNVASAQALATTLRESFPVEGHRHLIFAASSDKQIAEILTELAPQFHRFHLTRYQSNPRSSDPIQVASVLRELGKEDVGIHATPVEAWQAARAEAGADDGIVIAGSVFLAGELRPVILDDERLRYARLPAAQARV
jgi:dihydrofolate synthase/folylpolyglutamate synthase